MKKLLFIALMLSFLIGNAQQDRQQFGPNSSNNQDELYMVNHPGNPILVDLYKNDIRKTDNHPGNPIEIDLYKYAIRVTDNNYEDPILFDLYKYENRKTESNPAYLIDPNRYTKRKTD